MDKRCFKCGETKDRSEFYRHPMMGDGLLGKCKECTKRDSAERLRRITSTPEGLAAERERGRDKHHRLYRGKKLTGRRLAKAREAKRRWYYRNAFKKAAHVTVHRAIQKGCLVRPEVCEKCSGGGKIEAHHDDYSKPLEVRWLCVGCHAKHHRKPILPF